MADEFKIVTSDELPTRGRKPASASRTTRARSDKDTVDRAVAAMDNIYRLAALGLMAGQYIGAASIVADAKDDLQESNRAAFEASPALAKLIAGSGTVSAVGGFVVSHAVLAFTVVTAVQRDRAAKDEASQTEDADVPPPPTGAHNAAGPA